MNLTIELSDRQKKAFLLHNHEVGISESEAHKFMEYKKIFIDFECLFDIDVAIAFELCFKYNKTGNKFGFRLKYTCKFKQGILWNIKNDGTILILR